MSTPDLGAFIAGLPKAELHVHHVGSISPRIVADLASRHPDTPVPADIEQLRGYFAFTDFAHFIELYLSVVALVRTPEDVRMTVYEVARDLAAQHVRYAELTCTPYTTVELGVSPEAYCEAIEDARVAAERDFGLVLRWCFDIPGELGLPAAEETTRIAVDLAPDGLVAFGIGGPEIGVTRPQFKPYFDRARAAGLHSVPHAGETTGPDTIWDAIVELGAERVGHGVSAVRDPALLDYLVQHSVPLEVCPTSNLATGAVRSLDEHPLRQLWEAGVTVTINSDDPPMFGTTLSAEYAVAAELLALGADGIVTLVRNAVDASFAPDGVKRSLLSEVDSYVRAAVS